MKNIWIIANWKSNKNLREALAWVEAVGPKLTTKENLKIVVCPQTVELEEVQKKIQVGGYPLLVGCQDLSPFGQGAYTGEEAAVDLKDFITLAILGHSERRQNFGESDEMVAQKAQQAIESGITPLVCVQGAEAPVPGGVKLVAFEPIEAIGTGRPYEPQQAAEVAQSLQAKYGSELTVLYGGSVDSRNVKGFLTNESLNGVLVGGASLDPVEFVKIVDQAISI